MLHDFYEFLSSQSLLQVLYTLMSTGLVVGSLISILWLVSDVVSETRRHMKDTYALWDRLEQELYRFKTLNDELEAGNRSRKSSS